MSPSEAELFIDGNKFLAKTVLESKKSNIQHSKEYIVCAAIWYKELDKMSGKWAPNILSFNRPKNINKGIVICGYRHPSCMYTMIAITGKRSVLTECGEYVQGFLTSQNRFVNREEAANIFVKSGGKLNYSDNELFSEDLY